MSNNKTRWEKDDPPNTLLAIDPGASWPDKKEKGLPYVGVAFFQWGELAWGGVVRCPTTVPMFQRPFALVERVCKEVGIPRFAAMAGKRDRHGDLVGGEPLVALALEKPILYKKSEAKPQDIIELRTIYGAFMGGIEAEFYAGPQPGEWKGSIDKRIMNERVAVLLNSTEKILLSRSQAAGQMGLSDHTMDAVGIGLFTLGRCGKGGVV